MKQTIHMIGYGLLIIWLWGCAAPSSPLDRPQPTNQDRRLEIKIKDDLRQSSHVPAHAITVTVKGGHVQLFGLVESPIHARQAEIIAQNRKGVESVENRIRVR